MAELSQAARYNLPQSRLNIPRISFPEPPRLPIPQEEAILAAGELRGAQIMATAEEKSAAARAQLIANIGNMLASLPQKVEESYWKGRQNKLRSQGMNLQGQLLAGDLSGINKLPAGTKLGADGSISFSPEDPWDTAYKKAQIDRLGRMPVVTPTDYDLETAAFQGTPLTTPATPGAPKAKPLLKPFSNASDEVPGSSITGDAIDLTATSIPEQATVLGKKLSSAYGGRFDQFADRDIRGRPGVKSQHATGSAIDYFNDPEVLGQVAEQVANPNTASRVIFNRRIWEPDSGWRAYNGKHPHTDHVHIEPVLPGAKTSSVETPYLDSFGDEISLARVGPEPGPISFGAGFQPPLATVADPAAPAAPVTAPEMEVRKPTMVREPGGLIRRFLPGEGGEVMTLPGQASFRVPPGKTAASSAEEIAAKMDEKLAMEGFDVANMTLAQKQEALRGTDIRGRTKLTDTQKNSLQAAAKATGLLTAIEQDFGTLEKQGKVGILSPRRAGEKVLSLVGEASYDFSNFNAKVKSNLFTLARALQGAGVLTEKDIQRMEQLSPTGDMKRPQFMGNLDAAKDVMLGQLKTWKAVNLSALSEGQIEMVDEVVATLGGGKKATTGTSTATAPSATTPIIVSDGTEKAPIIITTKAQHDALKPGQYYIFNGRPGLKK